MHIRRTTIAALVVALTAGTLPLLASAAAGDEVVTFPDGSQVIFSGAWSGLVPGAYGSEMGAMGVWAALEGNVPYGTAQGNATDSLVSGPAITADQVQSGQVRTDWWNAPYLGFTNELGQIGLGWWNTNFTTASEYMNYELQFGVSTGEIGGGSRTQRDSQGRITALFSNIPTGLGFFSDTIPEITACYPNEPCPYTQGSSNLSCSITFDQNPLTGASTTMHWSSTGDPTLFYINGISYVTASGSAQVFSTGDYSGTVTDANGNTASCPAVLQGPGGSGGGGQCTAGSSSLTCNPLTGNLVDSCGDVTACQYGCSTQTNTCNNQCVPQRLCDASGTKVVDSCTGALLEDCAAEGDYCAAGQCVAPEIQFVPFDAFTPSGTTFPATGHLQVAPTLVPKGQSVRVYWQVANAKGCTVTGGNGDGLPGAATGAWATLFSGTQGKTTSGINAQTVYTLSCQALSPAAPDVNESVTVNILPSFNEQ
jgi:hypothetical protein